MTTLNFSGDQARHVERRLADADHRRSGDAARGVEPGVVETGDDEGVSARAPWPISARSPGTRKRFVEIALDAGRTEVGIDGADLDAGRGGGLRGGADLLASSRRWCLG